jgi:hypothetical protein
VPTQRAYTFYGTACLALRGYIASKKFLKKSYGGITFQGPVAELVGIEGGVVSGVFNLESSGVEAPDRRPRHEEHYHEA